MIFWWKVYRSLLCLIVLCGLGRVQCAAAAAQRTLVMAAALGYVNIDIFRTFLVSLREIAQYKGDVVLFVKGNERHPPAIKALLRRFDVQLLPFLSTDHISRHGSRISRYVANVRACGPQYRACFAVDFRDLFFQSEPFAAIEEHLPHGVDLMLSAEDPLHRLSFGNFNPQWLSSCWGHEFLKSVGDQVTLCSGTILGTPRGFEQLRDIMAAELAVTRKNRHCTARDQGHLNYLYYSGQLNKSMTIRIEQRGYGLVNTHAKVVPPTLGADGSMVNVDGSLSPVVHQFDRSDELLAFYRRKALQWAATNATNEASR